MGIGFVIGATVLYFELPGHYTVINAMYGIEAWHDRWAFEQQAVSSSKGVNKEAKIVHYNPDVAWNGYTLYLMYYDSDARIVDMNGKLLHTWHLRFGDVWPQAPHVTHPVPDRSISWFQAYLYPNGDLLAVYHGEGDTPMGYGLVKLD